MQRLSYELRPNTEQQGRSDLIRIAWDLPNRTAQTPKTEQILLTNIESLDLLFITKSDQLLNSWPPLDFGAETGGVELKALSLTLELEDYGAVTRPYPIHPPWSRDEIGS